MKNAFAIVAALPLLLCVTACSSGDSSKFVGVGIQAADIIICCDPSQGAPGKVGQFNVGVVVPVDVVNAETKITYTAASPARLSVASGATLLLDNNTVDVLLDHCNFTEVVIDVTVEITGTSLQGGVPYKQTVTQRIKITNTCPPVAVTPPQTIAEEIIGAPIANFSQYTMSVPVGILINNSNLSIQARFPDPKTEAFQVGAIVTDLSAQQLDDAFTGANALFPVGNGAHGRTLEPEFATPMMPGRYLLTWQCTQASIPIADPTSHSQYAYVADRDLNPGNNYFGSPPFTGDYWNNSDIQFSAQYTPSSDWRLQVTIANGTGGLQAEFSSARVILYNQVNFSVIPVAELGTAPEIAGRYTSFCHDGGFGQNGGEWSGDQTPLVTEPMFSRSLALSF